MNCRGKAGQEKEKGPWKSQSVPRRWGLRMSFRDASSHDKDMAIMITITITYWSSLNSRTCSKCFVCNVWQSSCNTWGWCYCSYSYFIRCEWLGNWVVRKDVSWDHLFPWLVLLWAIIPSISEFIYNPTDTTAGIAATPSLPQESVVVITGCLELDALFHKVLHISQHHPACSDNGIISTIQIFKMSI